MDNTKVDDVINYIAQTYDVTPEYLFRSDPECCVFRHRHSKKWFGIIMNISADKVGLEADYYVDVLNVKCDPQMAAYQKGRLFNCWI